MKLVIKNELARNIIMKSNMHADKIKTSSKLGNKAVKKYENSRDLAGERDIRQFRLAMLGVFIGPIIFVLR